MRTVGVVVDPPRLDGGPAAGKRWKRCSFKHVAQAPVQAFDKTAALPL